MDWPLPALFVAALAIGYLLGSIPFGLILTRAAGLGDIRAIGSGNIGATNVLRTGRKDIAALTLLLDGGKGTVAALLGNHFGPDVALVAAGAAFLGHLFPVWLKFKGGKGVATFLGILLGLAWPVGLLACATWLVAALVFRYSSLSALLAALLAPVYAWFLSTQQFALFMAALAIVVFVRHDQNIRRLLRGEEPKIGRKS